MLELNLLILEKHQVRDGKAGIESIMPLTKGCNLFSEGYLGLRHLITSPL